MPINRLLKDQIESCLNPVLLKNAEIKKFIDHIEATYIDLEQKLAHETRTVIELREKGLVEQDKIANEYNHLNAKIDQLQEQINTFNKSNGFLDPTTTNQIVGEIKAIKETISLSKETIALYRDAAEKLKLLENFIANSADAMQVSDINGNMIYANNEACNRLGLDKDKIFQYKVKDFEPYFIDPKNWTEHIQELRKKDRVVIQSTNINQLTSQVIDVEVTVTLRKIGDLDYIIAISRDISDKRKEEIETSNQEAQIMAIFDHSLDAVVIMESTGIITQWNPAAAKIFGYTTSEAKNKFLHSLIIAQPYYELYIEELKLRNNQFHNNNINNNNHTNNELKKEIELIAITKDKTALNITLGLAPIQINEKNYFIGYINDITERKKAEIELIKQQEKYRFIIANMNLGLVEVDNDDKIIYANQSFCNMSGYQMDELVGRTAANSFLILEDKNWFTEKLNIRKKGFSDSYEVMAKNKRGELKWWLISGGPNYDAMGNVIGSIGIHLDITEQKETQDQLKLARVNADQSSKAKEQFLTNMSHEIRTPLNAIIGMVRELSRLNLEPEAQNYLKHTYSASQHLLSILNNILDISKIDAGELILEERDFKLVDTIREVEAILSPIIADKNLTFQINIDDDIAPAFIGDELRIKQILINIIGNAIKFTDKGQITFTIKVTNSNNYFQSIQFIINDTGIGIDDEYLDKIFDKFSQENNTISRRFGGTGLGMAIAYELVTLMKGRIRVDSKKNEGSTFEISVRFKIGNQQNVKTLEYDSSIDWLKGKKILLAEDSDLNQLVAVKTLSHYDVEVTVVANGQEAIDELQKNKFDLILMDLQMPIMDGLTTTNYIRQTLKLNIPIIALTANAFKSHIDSCMDAGMNDFIIKPFEEHSMVMIIIRVLSKVKQQHTLSTETHISDTSNMDTLYSLQKLLALSHGDEEFINKMMTIFVTNTPPALDSMEVALEKGDIITVSQLAHRIKPGINNLMITLIAQDIHLLEQLKNGGIEKREAELAMHRTRAVLELVIEDMLLKLEK